MKRKAIIGLDGLAPHNVIHWDFRQSEWNQLRIETQPTTIVSWNAIFSGRNLENVYGFEKMPDDLSSMQGSMGDIGGERYTYEDIKTNDHLWERDDIDVTVVEAPVFLPGYNEFDFGNDILWPTNEDEFDRSMETLTEHTVKEDKVITVFPFPDKMNHMVDNRDSEYTNAKRKRQMKTMVRKLHRIEREFDEVVVLSDHGRPWGPYYITDDVWAPSHVAMGVVKSNAFDTQGYTNMTIYGKLVEFLKD